MTTHCKVMMPSAMKLCMNDESTFFEPTMPP